MLWLRRHWKAVTATIVVLVALGVGIPYLYIHAIEGKAPAPLALPGSAASSSTGTGAATEPDSSGSVDGTYTVSSGSQAGYRVHEVLAGQSTTAVGRTSQVSGTLTVTHGNVTAARFVVQMASVTSDRSQRDNQFRGRIMDVTAYPTGSFTLTKTIDLGTVPRVGTVFSETAVGTLTLHGTSKPVRLALQAERTSNGIDVSGTTTISYGAYGIDNPSFGGFVSVGSSGAFEVLLHLAKT